jgi:hypothetical protein
MRELFVGGLNQSSQEKLTLLLLDSSGNPVTGLIFSDLTFQYIREGDTSLMNYILSAGIFNEVGSGIYQIDITSAITAYEGILQIIMSGGTIETTLFRYDVVAGVPGNVQVTITVDDGLGTGFPDTQVDIWDSGQTTMLWSGVTNSSGQVVTALNPGSYKVLLRRSRTSFTVPESLTVVGPGAETVTFSGTETSLSTPTSPDTCIIYGSIFDINGEADDQMSPESIVVTAHRTRTPIAYSGRLYTLDKEEVKAGSDGVFEIVIARGINIKLTIPRVGIEKIFTVPDAASVDIATLL